MRGIPILFDIGIFVLAPRADMAARCEAGSIIASHVNDGGFWISKHFKMSVKDTLKPLRAVTVLSLVGFALAALLYQVVSCRWVRCGIPFLARGPVNQFGADFREVLGVGSGPRCQPFATPQHASEDQIRANHDDVGRRPRADVAGLG